MTPARLQDKPDEMPAESRAGTGTRPDWYDVRGVGLLIRRAAALSRRTERRQYPWRGLHLIGPIVVVLAVVFAPAVRASVQNPPEKNEPGKNADSTEEVQKTTEKPGDKEDDQGGRQNEAGEGQDAEPENPGILILEGQITDYIGGGVSAVVVTVRRKGEADAPGEIVGTAETDRLGDFQIRVPQPYQGDVVVTFFKASYAPLERELHLGDQEYPPYLAETLEGNLTLSGRVTDALTEDAISQASVTVRSMYRDWDSTTDDAGHFEVKGIVPTPGEIVVEAKGFGREQERINNLGEAEDNLEIQLKPERIVNLTVVDESDRPIRHVTIELNDEERDDFRTVVTNEQGQASVRGLHFDARKLVARLTHPQHVSSVGFDREIVTPEDKPISEHRLVMQQAGAIAGRVTSRDTGKPVYGARLITGDVYADQTPRDWTDMAGNYEIKGVAPGSTTVTVHVAGFAPDLATVDVQASQTAKVVFRLGSPRTLQGIVKNQRGEPVAGAQVEATKWRGFGTLGLRAITDQDGRFTIENAPDDKFEVTVYARNVKPLPQVVSAVPGNLVELAVEEMERTDGSVQRSALRVGTDAPAVTFHTLNGKSFDLSSLHGKIVVLDFWATWCGPCVAEMPKVKSIHDKFGADDRFVLIGVSLDFDKKALTSFLEKNKIGWAQVFDNDNKDKALGDTFGVTGIPSMFLINPEGKIDAVDPRVEDLKTRIEKLLTEK